MPSPPSTSAWIFLCGMMGSGKTTVGRALAAALSARFVDLDAEVEQRSSRTISEIFATDGEASFRVQERQALESVLAEPSDARLTVLALGGGTWAQPGVPEVLASLGPSFFLDVPVDELERRLQATDRAQRPLLLTSNLRARLERLLSLRRPSWELTDYAITIDPSRGCSTVAEIVLAILARLDERGGRMAVRRLSVELGERSYPIFFAVGGAEQAASLVSLAARTLPRAPQRLFIVTDSNVAALHGELFVARLIGEGWQVHTTVIRPGEASKSVEAVSNLWSSWLEAGITRHDVVVALGGGVVGDLAGFAAATVLRGVRVLQVPTTILSQVDSSVGGKTGINVSEGKNLVGAFHQPSAVVMALGMLTTLAPEEIASGVGEVIKYAVLDGPEMMAELERTADQIASAPAAALDLIVRCCAIKARIVAEDERESGARALLNLGHTFGHAIEAMDGFGQITHGAAVGLGMLLAVDAAAELELTSASDAHDLYRRLVELYKAVGLPTDPTPWLQRHGEMTTWMLRDKKAAHDRITLVLPVTSGDVRLCPMPTERLGSLMQRLAEAPLRT